MPPHLVSKQHRVLLLRLFGSGLILPLLQHVKSHDRIIVWFADVTLIRSRRRLVALARAGTKRYFLCLRSHNLQELGC
jgi:hypothetical protein